MKPILFNTEMVKAVLDGRKTQTRRIIPNEWIQSDKAPIPTHGEDSCVWHFWNFGEKQSKYKTDDVLYVRETFIKCLINDVETILYKADGHTELDGSDLDFPWTPSIHMPKKYARIFLKVTKVKVERLQDISLSNIEHEGLEVTLDMVMADNTNALILNNWINLWNLTAKDGYKWEDNPYVFVYEFERVKN